MSTIKTIAQLKQEKSEQELDLIFSDFTTIIEKIKGHRFSVIKTKNSIDFFGKKSKRPLSTLDRIVSDLYESVIHYILKIDKNIFRENCRYGFYFPMNDDTNTKKPKNGLMLTDITNRNFINLDTRVLRSIASKMKVEGPPILFSGKLTESQQNLLKNEEFETPKEVLEKLLNGETPKPFFDDLDTIIFRSEFGRYTYYQIGNSKTKPFEKQDSNKFELLLIEILDFVENYVSLHNIRLTSTNRDIRYLELMNYVFLQFVQHNPRFIEENEISKPAFLNNSGNLSKRYISDSETLNLIENPDYEYLLRVFLTSFRSPIKPRGLISENETQRFSKIINFINEFVELDSVDFADVQKFYFRKDI